VCGNAGHLPFAEGSFDRVHCSWLLEHVRHPVEILREVRRVLAPGGYCHFTEVDNSSFRIFPEHPTVTEVMGALNQTQQRSGGDPFVGQKLGALMKAAGFQRVRLIPVPLRSDGPDRTRYRAFAEEFAEIFESLDEVLPQQLRPRIELAARRLRELPDEPGTAMNYCSISGQGWKE
jgi:SAM-dependent methyltransferase